MQRHIRLALAVVTASFLGASSAQAETTLKLDLRAPQNVSASLGGLDAPVQSPALDAGESYVFTVSGTGSTWPAARYGAGICGRPDPAPAELSAGGASSPAGWDAATLYGAPDSVLIGPNGRACVDVSLPLTVTPTVYSGFQFSLGGAFGRPAPVGGPVTAPTANHTYNFQVTGTGAPAKFRFADYPVSDNAGVLTIVVRTAAECAAINCLSIPQVTQVTGGTTPAGDAGTGGVAGATAACKLDRVLSVRLVQPKRVKFASTVYALNGKKLRTVKGKKIFIRKTNVVRAQKFRSLPTGVLSLTVNVVTTKGKKLKGTLSVTRCQPRIKARLIKYK